MRRINKIYNNMKRTIIVILTLVFVLLANAQVESSTQQVDSVSVAQLIENTHAINENTDAWHGSINVFVSILALLSSVFSIIAGVFAFGIWRDRRVSKKMQLAIIDDLIRHFFVNKSILLRIQKNADNIKEAELTFKKMAVLNDDLNMNRFTIYPRYYKCVHEIEFQARNYNMYCEWIAQQYAHLSKTERLTCIDNLISRAERLTNYLDMLKQVIVESHFKDFFADVVNPIYKCNDEVIIDAFAHNYKDNLPKVSKEEQVAYILNDLVCENINYLDLQIKE